MDDCRNFNETEIQGGPKVMLPKKKLNISVTARPNGLIFLPRIKTYISVIFIKDQVGQNLFQVSLLASTKKITLIYSLTDRIGYENIITLPPTTLISSSILYQSIELVELYKSIYIKNFQSLFCEMKSSKNCLGTLEKRLKKSFFSN